MRYMDSPAAEIDRAFAVRVFLRNTRSLIPAKSKITTMITGQAIPATGKKLFLCDSVMANRALSMSTASGLHQVEWVGVVRISTHVTSPNPERPL